MRELTPQKSNLIVWTMLSLMPIIGMCIDLMAPSLPAIAKGLQVTELMSKNTISIYLLGFALGNFFTGFLTDAWGRKQLIRLSLLGFALASLIPIFSPDIFSLLLSRFLQGYMIGATSVLLRSVCADVLSVEQLTHLGPWFGTMWGLGPVFGPVLGGYFQAYFGWQAGFYFFASVGLIALIAVFFILPETHFNRSPLKIKNIQNNITEIFKNPLFLGIVTLMGVTYSLLIIFNMSAPFLIQTRLHQTPIFFGQVALYLGLVFLIATLVARVLIKKLRIEYLWAVVINAGLLIGIGLLIASYFFSTSIPFIIIASAVMFMICGIVFPISLGKGLSLFRHIAGTATAVMYLVNISICSFASYWVSFVKVNTAYDLLWIYIIFLVLIFLIYWCVLRQKKDVVST